MNLRQSFFENDLRNPDAFIDIVTNHDDMYKIMKYVEAISKAATLF